ncbi:hypothetical protein E2986_12193 [Frieseomelitta varia]|uniref:Major facilitator superfamily (MFS) profile domain-containing protein n=1 Tax=Frieseomelitta varia TaxID=561572 RepID=A0A833S5W0_9HYME|nr:hypothetical protein E2986_12193 [Frieseomelitta varia]
MAHDHRISIVTVPDKPTEHHKTESDEANRRKSGGFEAAIAAAGHGKFQYLLLLAIIPVSWATSIDTSSVAIILPSAECDLQMTFFQKGVLNAVTYVGMVSSGFLWGYIADVKGRRSVFLYGYLADSICNILSGFSQNFWMLACFKFLNGFIISGPHASIVAYTSEFFGDRTRGKIPLILGFSITFGNIVSAGLAFIVIPQRWSVVLWDGAFVYNSWRLFLSACGVPILIGASCLSLFPESPKFLMSQGRMEDALKVFKKIYRINTGKSADEYPNSKKSILNVFLSTVLERSLFQIDYLENELPKAGFNDNDHDGKIKKRAIFFNPHLPRIIMVMIIQFGSMYTTNTTRLWQPQLFTILENFDPADHNLTAEHSSTFCEILDLSTVANGTFAATAGNATCTNVGKSNSLQFAVSHRPFSTNFRYKYQSPADISYGVAFACIVGLYWSSEILVTLILTSFFIGLTNTTQNIIIAATVIMFPTSLRSLRHTRDLALIIKNETFPFCKIRTIAVSLVMTIGRIGSIVGNMLFPILLAQGCIAPMIQLACLILLFVGIKVQYTLLYYFFPLYYISIDKVGNQPIILWSRNVNEETVPRQKIVSRAEPVMIL